MWYVGLMNLKVFFCKFDLFNFNWTIFSNSINNDIHILYLKLTKMIFQVLAQAFSSNLVNN